jgi:hypothetical protein
MPEDNWRTWLFAGVSKDPNGGVRRADLSIVPPGAAVIMQQMRFSFHHRFAGRFPCGDAPLEVMHGEAGGTEFLRRSRAALSSDQEP